MHSYNKARENKLLLKNRKRKYIHSTTLCILKKSAPKWTRAVRTLVVQGSTVVYKEAKTVTGSKVEIYKGTVTAVVRATRLATCTHVCGACPAVHQHPRDTTARGQRRPHGEGARAGGGLGSRCPTSRTQNKVQHRNVMILILSYLVRTRSNPQIQMKIV